LDAYKKGLHKAKEIKLRLAKMNTLSVKFELPRIIASQVGFNFDNISKEVKQILALFLYEHKHISLSKACEIGGVSQWEFFEMNRQLSIPIHYTQNELENDLEKLSYVGKGEPELRKLRMLIGLKSKR